MIHYSGMQGEEPQDEQRNMGEMISRGFLITQLSYLHHVATD